MGVVTPSESKLAADIVARVAGVKSVVKVFEEMSEEQIRERMKYLEGSDRSVVASTVSDQNENDATEVRLQ